VTLLGVITFVVFLVCGHVAIRFSVYFCTAGLGFLLVSASISLDFDYYYVALILSSLSVRQSEYHQYQDEVEGRHRRETESLRRDMQQLHSAEMDKQARAAVAKIGALERNIADMVWVLQGFSRLNWCLLLTHIIPLSLSLFLSLSPSHPVAGC